jgi:NAD(P)H-dependent flavin oxidoreductase YrpB (nitropropane dioxygenase family)
VSNAVCKLLGIELPILQAGMGRTQGTPTPPALVAAVSNAGGM